MQLFTHLHFCGLHRFSPRLLPFRGFKDAAPRGEYAPMVRLAAPSAARPNTVLMEGQEQLNTDSRCLSYAPMVRLAAPSAARPNTVLMEGQEQLNTDSRCLSWCVGSPG
ncbi:hypothetical protein CRUP_035787 [Coryphaenoides rupestris]|nr:hypothetical protein CRUP_035787 [Coryphaenoides rupestris]